MKHFTEFKHCHLGLLLGRTASLKDKIIDAHMEPHGLTAAQFKVLMIMVQYGVNTPTEVCRFLSLDSGSMTRMFDRLEDKAFLIRHRSEIDARQVQLKFTEQGRQLAHRLPCIGAQAMNELAAALSAHELKTLEYLLKKILLAAGDPITLQRLGLDNER